MNSELIKINEDIMNMNQFIVDFNKKNIVSNKEMMKSDFNCPDISRENIKETEDLVIKKANTLEKKSKSNQEVAIELTKKNKRKLDLHHEK
jgi:4-diphosphocytidyl-2C-methyl-D-erythritol kinase